MKKIIILLLVFVAALTSCKKTPEVNLKYVDIERDLVTVGSTTANIQCDYDYITTLKKAYFYYGVGEDEDNMTSIEMRVVQASLYVELTGLSENTTYGYYYEFVNGFNSMRSEMKTFKTESMPVPPPEITLPTVITSAVTDITANSATCGGEITNDGGAEVTERGICWSTNENPTLDNSHIAVDSAINVFTATMAGLEENTTYHVRAYALNEKGTAYGLDKEFKTLEGVNSNTHDYVDLGLPSGTLWATCNVGANIPEEYGDHYAWGETYQKNQFEWGNYRYCMGDVYSMTKYCNNSIYGYNGFSDTLLTLLPEDDVASVNWKDGWRIPSRDEWQELYDNTTNTWTEQNGVNGLRFTSTNGNSIFLPAAGYHVHGNLSGVGFRGTYWSSSLDLFCAANAWEFYFTSDNSGLDGNTRGSGLSIRPVYGGASPTPPTPPGDAPEGAINGLFTINENGDQVYFSQGNLQYQASTNTWRFAEKQWDFVGCQNPYSGNAGGTVSGSDNMYISDTYNGWIDLFGWGTSGYNHGAVCYQPWSTSQNSSDYYAYGQYTYNLFDLTGQADWGYNAISNGGNQENYGWRTLSRPEYDYLLHGRNTLSGIRWVPSTVNSVHGIIILPDNWNTGVYQLNNANGTNYGNYESNVLSADDWTNVLEPHGAVFMPAAGERSNGTLFLNINTCGFYWSSSYYDNLFSLSLLFQTGGINTGSNYYRFDGRSVRLVRSQ